MKNKINYKLVNIALITLIIFLVYQTGHLWMGVVNKIIKILFPFAVAFVIAYALYPIQKSLQKKGLSKGLSITLLVAVVVAIIGFTIFLIVPLLFNQMISLFNAIIVFIKEISMELDYDLGPIQKSLTTGFNDIITSVGKYVSNGAINIINISLNFLTNVFLCFTAAIYFLIDMESIRAYIKDLLLRKTKRGYNYIKILDNEMKNYLTGFVQLMVISLFEYTIAYTIIGHPNAVLLGFLAMISQLIPYFGGIITNVIAGVTAFVVSPALFIRTVITFGILSVVDGNIIGPIVYGKTNQVKPVIVILSITTGGILLGITGIIISFPVAIILISTFKFFREDITDKLDDIKDSKKNKK